LRQQAVGQAMKTMAADGWDKVAQGVITTRKVFRITQE
jgi:type II secretory ATPase GspE/PulE/Tfp pilus assembly ATPase PilB-like protein